MKPVDFVRIKDSFIQGRVNEPVELERGIYSVTLEENESDAKLRNVQICNVPKDALLINLHNINPEAWLRGLFQLDSKQGLFQCCDYALLSARNIIFIELKSKSVDMRGVKNQLKSGTCLFTYCSSVLSQFYGTSIPFPGNEDYNPRYILISYSSSAKRPFRGKPPSNHVPENMRHYKVPNMSQINYQSLI